jgi:hypothetical protein
VPVFVLKPERPEPTPTPGIAVAHGPLRFVPDPGAARRTTAADITRFLGRFYNALFTSRQPEPDATPTPKPSVRLAQFFAARARATVDAHADVFEPGTGVDVNRGRLSFDGVVTMAGRRPSQAFLAIRFTGMGETRGTPVVLTHRGNVLLIHSEQGWLISGFDLKLDEASVTPSPSPSPR